MPPDLSLMETWARGRVGSVNVGVAGKATTAHNLRFRVRAVGRSLTRLQCTRVGADRMTLLAQNRNGCDQQGVLIRAVRRVAVQAALAHRRMLKEERPALLRMALIASFVDRVGLEQGIG